MRQMPETCAVVGPNEQVLECLDALLDERRYQFLPDAEHPQGVVSDQYPFHYAEIGVYQGATAAQVAKRLPEGARMFLFDFKDRLDEAIAALQDQSDLVDKDLDIHIRANTALIYDSYNWSLAKLMMEDVQFDFVFIDGAHTWAHDALAFLLIDRMLNDGGIVVFDDYGWSLKTSPTMNPEAFPEIVQQYTDEQLAAYQVKMIVDLLVKRDDTYEEIIPNVAYRKRYHDCVD